MCRQADRPVRLAEAAIPLVIIEFVLLTQKRRLRSSSEHCPSAKKRGEKTTVPIWGSLFQIGTDTLQVKTHIGMPTDTQFLEEIAALDNQADVTVPR